MRCQSFDKDAGRRSSTAINNEAADDNSPLTYGSLPTYDELHEQDLDTQTSLTGNRNISQNFHWPSDDKISAPQDEANIGTGQPPAYRPAPITGESDQLPSPSIATLNSGALGCTFVSNRVAVWRVINKDIRLSALGATVLMKEGVLSLHDLDLSVWSFDVSSYWN
jgi:hypothetical protein